VLCFGFKRRSVLVDTNTTRICTRVSGRDVRHRYQLRLELHGLAGAPGPDAEFNRALLDLGELVCRPAKPACDACPVRDHCAYGRTRQEKEPELSATEVEKVST
jgi:A/G-specific adenine glycosylase